MRHIVRTIVLVQVTFLALFSAGARRTWTSADQIQVEEPKQGLQFRLSAGQEAAGEPAATAAASVIGEPLSNQETDRILRRLPPFAPASRQKPVFPRAVVPPPRTGKTVLAAFPPQDHSSRPDIPPLEELRVISFAPEGEVPLAPHLSVTFSQPMVAVTSLENLSASIPDIFGQTLGRDIELTFTTAAMREGLAARGEPLVILDPAALPQFPVYTVNHSLLKVRMFTVEPSMWNAFLRCLEAKRKDEPNVEPPGQLVFSNTLEVKNLPDEPVETLIDLLPALQNGLGQIILTVEPPTSPKPGARQQTVWVWIQSTRIAVDAFVDGNVLMSQVTSLHDGSPVPNAEILLIPSSSSSRTGPDGIAEIPLPSYPVDIALARLGKDEVFVPQMMYWWSPDSLWQRKSNAAELRWFVFDDRKMYRPGEEVHIKGWLRSIGTDKAGDIGFVGKSVARKITWKLQDSEETKIAEGAVSASAFHSFDFSLKLPVGMNLGTAQLTLAASRIAGISDGIVYNHEIEVQEFRRPEYEVTIDVSAGPHFVGDSGTATVKATYYTGSGLSNAEVNWQVLSSPGHFTPPNRADFVFGSWSPWWTGGRSNQNDRTNQEEFSSRTDAAGKHTLRIDFDSVNPPSPSDVSISASVREREGSITGLECGMPPRICNCRPPTMDFSWKGSTKPWTILATSAAIPQAYGMSNLARG
jgi:hypothetical protein